jgi:hypothetical protein
MRPRALGLHERRHRFGQAQWRSPRTMISTAGQRARIWPMTWRSTSATSTPSRAPPLGNHGRAPGSGGTAHTRRAGLVAKGEPRMAPRQLVDQLANCFRPVGDSAAAGNLVEAVAEQLHHRRHHAFECGRARKVLQPADGRLRAQLLAALRQPPDRHLERGISTQRVAVVGPGLRRGRLRDSPPR